MKIFLVGLMFLSASAFALEVDEKLTVRILKTSETRKTIMVNRGTEDGLVEGDHAKFIMTSGIVARAVSVRVSPTRSVWAVYRLVNADYIVNDAVMTLKITPAVKITKDDSKMLVQDDTPTRVSTTDPRELGIPLADGAQDLADVSEVTADGDDLRALDDGPSIIPEKNYEVFGILNISSLSASSKTDIGDDSFTSSQSYHHIGLGGELYPQKEREWYSKFSVQASINLMRLDNQSYNGASTANDVTELSAGVNWHPTKMPSQTMTFIPYIHLSFNMGTVKSKYEPGSEGNGNTEGISANGSTQGFAAGFGYKFYTKAGFGARAILDYYMRTEKFKEDEATNTFNKTVRGPRFMLGLGYRF
jgi:hypothetical protein